MTIVRRVLLFALIAVCGTSLLAPLSARSSPQPPATPRSQPLVAVGEPRSDAPRGGVLSARGSTLGTASRAAEALVPRPADAPVTVTMEATLVGIPSATPTVPRPTATFSGDGVWDALAKCESGGNWAINSGNGYYGGLQFSLGTWNQYGGTEFAEYPHQATREEQIVVAERLRVARGYAPWPACRAKLGLP